MVVESSGIEVEQLWHDRTRWASWIDGFTHLEKLEGEWPLEGTRRVYRIEPDGVARVRDYFDDFWSDALGRFREAARKETG